MTTGAAPSSPSTTARPRRSRPRTFLPLGVAAWLVLEVWLLTVVAGAAGGPAVILLLVAGFLLGGVVVKRAGRRAFQRLNEALRRGGAPADDGEGSGLLMLAGLLLMLPGVLSDAAGLLLLLPPVRRVVRGYTERALERRLRASAPGGFADAFQQARIHHPGGRIVQGEVIRQEPHGDTPHEDRPPLTR
jgi:UPF0716 protein FxsA